MVHPLADCKVIFHTSIQHLLQSLCGLTFLYYLTHCFSLIWTIKFNQEQNLTPYVLYITIIHYVLVVHIAAYCFSPTGLEMCSNSSEAGLLQSSQIMSHPPKPDIVCVYVHHRLPDTHTQSGDIYFYIPALQRRQRICDPVQLHSEIK